MTSCQERWTRTKTGAASTRKAKAGEKKKEKQKREETKDVNERPFEKEMQKE